MINALTFIQKNLVWAIAMISGLFFGYLFDAGFLKQFIIPVTFVMVYPMMVTLNVKTIFTGRDLKLQTATQVINFILIPLLAFSIGKIFLSGQDPKYGLWAVGLFLIGVLPTSWMTISWTGFAKGRKEGLTIALLISLAYIIQIQSAAWYVKFINVMFGPPRPVKPKPDARQTVLT
ncbi:MAG: hypothetical protein AB1Z38_13590 [Desulfotignum sp.]